MTGKPLKVVKQSHNFISSSKFTWDSQIFFLAVAVAQCKIGSGAMCCNPVAIQQRAAPPLTLGAFIRHPFPLQTLGLRTWFPPHHRANLQLQLQPEAPQETVSAPFFSAQLPDKTNDSLQLFT